MNIQILKYYIMVENLRCTLRNGVGKRHIVAVSLSVVPVLFSLMNLDGTFFDSIAALLFENEDGSVARFRMTVLSEAAAALMAFAAFSLLYTLAASRNARMAAAVLALCELYMFSYYLYMLLNPESRSSSVDIAGSILLLISIIACCYGYSLFCADRRLEPERRSWAVFMFMPYIMSFAALFAPAWQQHIPLMEDNSRLMLDFSPLYQFFAFLWNVARCIAVWKLFTSSLFIKDGMACRDEAAELSPLNRYMLAILVASLFVVNGLALVYKNALSLLEL